MAKTTRKTPAAKSAPATLRSRAWFDNPDNPDMTALYLERYLNFGLTPRGTAVRQADHRHRPDRLRPRRPATATTSSWPSACATASATPAASPSNSRCIRSRRPASARPPALDRNLAYLGLVEMLYGYPLDGVVLTIGCDKTTPAC